MLAFLKPKPKPVAAPAPPQPSERESILLKLHQCDAQLGVLGDKLREFRKTHFALVHGVPCLVASHLDQREQLETELRTLSNAIFRLRDERSKVLAEYAELRGKQVTTK